MAAINKAHVIQDGVHELHVIQDGGHELHGSKWPALTRVSRDLRW